MGGRAKPETKRRCDRAFRERRKAYATENGLCTQCLDPVPADHGTLRCTRCQAANLDSQRRWRERGRVPL